jgi:hypothetical protein
MYEGALYDPLDGRQIATVEGIELVRPIHDITNLAIDTILKNNSTIYDDAQSMWSQKVFCYTSTSASASATSTNTTLDDTKAILRTVRVRPQSPRKHVPLDQAVIVYETATTFISRRKRRKQRRNQDSALMPSSLLSQNEADENEDEELWVHSEFPSGRSLWGKSNVIRPSSTTTTMKKNAGSIDNIDFTVYTKTRSPKSPDYKPDLTIQENKDDGADGVVISPKRSTLIQFGSSEGTMESKHKFGARETYSYRTTTSGVSQSNPLFSWMSNTLSSILGKDTTTSSSSSTTVLRYTRYGEGPPFYAPGRMCMLELTARPVDSVREVTPIVRKLVASDGQVKGFHWPDRAATTTIQQAWGREIATTTTTTTTPTRKNKMGSPSLLRLEYDPLMYDYNGAGGRRSCLFVRRSKVRLTRLWEKIQAATILETN